MSGTAELQSRLDALCMKLRAHGHRLTPQRMAVVRALFTCPDHPTIDQIYESVKTEFPMTSLATVYKTVNVLKELGEVREISFSGEGSRYDGHTPITDTHSHLICTACKMIIDLNAISFSEAAAQAEKQYGFKITDQRHDFFGVCPACQNKNEM